MNAPTKFALGALAIVAIALGGSYLFGIGSGASIGGPAPSATHAAVPTATPWPFPTDTTGEVPVAPGTYVLDLPGRDGPTGAATTIRVVFTMPEGWEKNMTPTNLWHIQDHRRVGFFAVDDLFADPCSSSGATMEPRVGPTVADLVTGLGRVRGLTASTATDVTIGGFSGKQLDLTAPADPSPCVDSPALWTAVVGPGSVAPAGAAPVLPSGERLHLDILDVAGSRLIVARVATAQAVGAADLTEMQTIVDSMVIERVATSPSPS